MKDVAGKVAVVTGGVSGIGLGIARTLLRAGMRVVVTYRRADHLQDAFKSFESIPDCDVCALRLDVTDRAAVSGVAAAVARRFEKVHVLCNNAGVNMFGAADEATFEDWDWILGVNLAGPINVLKAFLPGMKAHGEGGHVVNVASMAAFIGGPHTGVYATSKFALRGLSESLRYDLAPLGIGVSLLCPGLTRSNIYEATLNRPAHLANTAVPFDPVAMKRMADMHSAGMDADEVGRKMLEGMLQGQFYIFSHPEFKEEVRELCDEVVSAFPNGKIDPKRMGVEMHRRHLKNKAKRAIESLR